MATGRTTTIDPDTISETSQPLPPGAIALYCVSIPLFEPMRLGAESTLVLGRLERDGWPEDGRVSRTHAKAGYEAPRWSITDLDSKNGTFVGGEEITDTVVKEAPVVIRIGETILLLTAELPALDPRALSVDGEYVIGPTLGDALARIRSAAAHSRCLLIGGESGAGKERAAAEFHRAGPNRTGPFLPINCAAVPQGVAERLFFGSIKGAYSGADADAEGYLAAADGGTLFLDEIAELDLAVQAKLLRAIETQEMTPLGAARARKINVRWCSASLKNLRVAVKEGKFRPDLFYRISHEEVTIPPLRERLEEIPWLVARALDRDQSAHARLIETCLLREWPGNVRELLAATRRAAASARARGANVVRASDLPEQAGISAAAETPPPKPALTVEVVRKTIDEQQGNVAAAARALGIQRAAFYRLLKRLGIDPRSTE